MASFGDLLSPPSMVPSGVELADMMLLSCQCGRPLRREWQLGDATTSPRCSCWYIAVHPKCCPSCPDHDADYDRGESSSAAAGVVESHGYQCSDVVPTSYTESMTSTCCGIYAEVVETVGGVRKYRKVHSKVCPYRGCPLHDVDYLDSREIIE